MISIFDNVRKNLIRSRADFVDNQYQLFQTDVATLKTDVSGLKEDTAVLKTDVATLKTDVSSLKEDTAILKEESSITRTAVNKLLDWADDASIQIVPLFKKAK